MLHYSIVIPAYNAALTLRPTLQSVFEYMPKNTEVIVIDDGSNDATVLIAGEFPCILLKNPNNQGAAAARNLGINHANNEIILFLDADVVLSPKTFSRFDRLFRSNEPVDAVVGMYSDNLPHHDFPSYYQLQQQRAYHRQTPYHTNALFTACSAVRKAVFDRVGTFDESICGALMEDVELGKRIDTAGFTIVFDKDLHVQHLKKYHWKNLLLTRINRARGMGSLFFLKSGITEMRTKGGRFLSIPLYLILSMIVSPLLLISILFCLADKPGSCVLTAPLMLWLFFLQRVFLAEMWKKGGAMFLLKSIFFLPLDLTICLTAAIFGCFEAFLEKSNQNTSINAKNVGSSIGAKVRATALRAKPFFFKNTPVLVTFFVTARCNMFCSHCFYSCTKPNAENNELTLDEIQKISLSMPSFPWLILTGGEPFLRNDLVNISRTFIEHNHITNLTIPTNGQLKGRILAWIGEMDHFNYPVDYNINLSFYGPESIHDSITGIAGSYQKTLSTASTLEKDLKNKRRFRLVFSIPAMRDNQHFLIETIKELKVRFPTTRINLGLTRGIPRCVHQKDVSPEIYAKAAHFISANPYHDQHSSFLQHFFSQRDSAMHEYITDVLLDRAKYHSCYAGKMSVVVSETGTIYPCELIDKPLGKLREVQYQFDRIWKSEQRKKILKNITTTQCQCTHECNYTVNRLYTLHSYFR